MWLHISRMREARRALDAGVTFQRIEIYFRGFERPSNTIANAQLPLSHLFLFTVKRACLGRLGLPYIKSTAFVKQHSNVNHQLKKEFLQPCTIIVPVKKE